MAYDYEKLYQSTPRALGEANPVVTDFFAGRDPGLAVLDIGCGQGRDALTLGRMGHKVHGIDLAPSGVAQMLSEAKRGNLPVTGEVADVTSYRPGETVDVLLIDRTLHMLPEEAARVSVLETLIRAVGRGGWVLLLDEPSNMGAFERVLLRQAPPWSPCYQGTPRASLRPVTGTMFAQRPD